MWMIDFLVQAMPVPCDTGGGGYCPTSAYSAVAAAYATIGYWVQSDLLDVITLSEFGHITPLLYILSAFVGGVSLALGQPPKQYLWFFMGPAFYWWLIDHRTDVTGVRWQIGDVQQDYAQVAKIAEVGIVNTNQFVKMEKGVPPSKTRVATTVYSPPGVSSDKAPLGQVKVSNAFLWFDDLISSQVNWLVAWTGVGQLVDPRTDGGGSGNTNIAKRSEGISAKAGSTTSSSTGDKWYLLTNSKWRYLNNITDARLGSARLRDAFVSFTASECGDALFRSIDQGKYIAANKSQGRMIPSTIFKIEESMGPTATGNFDYTGLKTSLAEIIIPFPKHSLSELLKQGKEVPGSFRKAAKWPEDVIDELGTGATFSKKYTLTNMNFIRCDTYFDLLIMAFRWEAGHIYYQAFSDLPKGMSDIHAIYAILYGWAVKKESGSQLPLDGALEQRKFIRDLIFAYLLKNEFQFARQPTDTRYASSAQMQKVTETWNKSVGSKQKFGELYSWAQLIPYMQGILFYLLAIAYPVACMLIVMPGGHKHLVTWMSFWAWAKLWDLGFAVVASFERSLWAMTGNSDETRSAFDHIVEMQKYGSTKVTCGGSGEGKESVAPDEFVRWMETDRVNCTVPSVYLHDSKDAFIVPGAESFTENLRLFDLAYSVGPSLNLDLSNSYYIYIVAALYLAVPAVTGQLVLGAKSGAANMVNGAIGGISSSIGQQAGAGHQAQVAQMIKANQASMRQEGMAKSHRDGAAKGLAARALGQQRGAFEAKVEAGKKGMEAGILELADDMLSHTLLANKEQLTGGIAAFQAPGKVAGIYGDVTKAGSGKPTPPGGASEKTRSEPSPVGANPELTGKTPDVHLEGENPTSITGMKALSDALTGPKGAAERLTSLKSAMSAKKSYDSLKAGGEATPEALGAAKGAWEAARKNFGLDLVRLISEDGGNALGFMTSLGLADDWAKVYTQRAELKGESKSAGVIQQSLGFQADAHSTGSDFSSSGAEFQASSDSWHMMNDWANQVSASASVFGVSAGSLDAGAKPQDQKGMAFSGMINTYSSMGNGPVRSLFDLDRNDQAQGVTNYFSTGEAAQSIGQQTPKWLMEYGKFESDKYFQPADSAKGAVVDVALGGLNFLPGADWFNGGEFKERAKTELEEIRNPKPQEE